MLNLEKKVKIIMIENSFKKNFQNIFENKNILEPAHVLE
jgi:hypothetical protein